MNRSQPEVAALQQYVQVLERENESHRAESMSLHQTIERISSQCEHLRQLRSSIDPGHQSRLLIQKQVEISMLKEGHERWVSSLQAELDDFKIRYQAIVDGKIDWQQHQSHAPFSVVETVVREQTNIIETNLQQAYQEQNTRELYQLRQQLDNMSLRLNQEREEHRERHHIELEQLRAQLMRPQEDWDYQRNQLLRERQAMDQEIMRLRRELEEAKTGANTSTGGLKVRVHEPIRIVAGSSVQTRDDQQRLQEIHKLKTDVTRLQGLLIGANRTIGELTDQRTAKSSTINRLEADNCKLNEENIKLLRELDFVRQSKAVSTQNTTASSADEAYIRRLKEDKLNLEAESLRLRNELAASREEQNSLRREVAAQRAQFLVDHSQLNAELDSARSQLQSQHRNTSDVLMLQSNHELQLNSLVASLNNLKEQFDHEKHELLLQINDLTHKDKTNTDTIYNLTGELERHVRVREQNKQSEGEIASLRQELAEQKELNYQLKGNMPSATTQDEYLALLNVNRELERRVYVLENANFSLSDELTRRERLLGGKGLTGIAETLNDLKEQIQNYKQSHASVNNRERMDRCSEETIIQRKKVTITSPDEINIEDRQQSEADKRATVLPVRREQRISRKPSREVSQQSRSPTHSRRVSKIGDLSAKLKSIKTENEQLKRSLAGRHDRSSSRLPQ